MRINKFVAASTGMSRRAADQAIRESRVTVNGRPASLGDAVNSADHVSVDGQTIELPAESLTILLHKPVGYVTSRDGQGSRTIYDLLPDEYRSLKPVGRLDKDSSGLLLLTSDGELANQLTHPRYAKTKMYQITLDKPLEPLHQQIISDSGVQLPDGPSRLMLQKSDDDRRHWQVTMREGRNRQIRRTFAALDYTVTSLHRTCFGEYRLNQLTPGEFIKL